VHPTTIGTILSQFSVFSVPKDIEERKKMLLDLLESLSTCSKAKVLFGIIENKGKSPTSKYRVSFGVYSTEKQ
jgi:hypothetical protein